VIDAGAQARVLADRSEILRTLTLLYEPGDVVELRAPKSGKLRTQSGYFDDFDLFADAACRLSGTVPGVYTTLNPVKSALLARYHNRVQPYAEVTTGDDDIVERRWIPLDFDPRRPPGISSTEHEHEAALDAARACRTWLVETGGISPQSLVLADSGNGGHLLIRVTLPNTPEARMLVQHCIEATALYCGTDDVLVDPTVFNASRIWKVYGTMACKGDVTADRPHRLARLLEVPA
jgi:hypothetical protein